MRAIGDQAGAAVLLRGALTDVRDPDLRRDLLLDLATVEARVATQDAIDHYRAALAPVDDPAERSEIRPRLAVCLSGAGRSIEALDELDQAMKEAATPEARLRASVAYCAAARCSLDTRPLGRERLRLLADQAAALDPSEPSARNVLGELAYEQALACTPHDAVVAVASRALGPAMEGLRELSPLTRHVAILSLLWAGEVRVCERAAGLLLARGRRRGARADVALASQLLMNVHWVRGWLRRRSRPPRVSLAAIPEGLVAILPGTYGFRAAALAELGRVDDAVAALDLPGGPESWSSHTSYHAYLVSRARVLRLAADPSGAHRAALQCGAIATAMGTLDPAVLPWRSEAALAASALGDLDEARAQAAEELRMARRFGAARPLAMALVAAADVAEQDVALELLEEAAAQAARTPDRLVQAAVEGRLASARRGRAQRTGPIPTRHRIVALGEFSVFDGRGRDVTPAGVAGRAVRVLVAAGRPLHLEALAEHLWQDDASSSSARARLRNVLSRARTASGPLIVRHGDLVSLTPDRGRRRPVRVVGSPGSGSTRDRHGG